MGTITANFIKPRALINLLLQISSEGGRVITRAAAGSGRQPGPGPAPGPASGPGPGPAPGPGPGPGPPETRRARGAPGAPRRWGRAPGQRRGQGWRPGAERRRAPVRPLSARAARRGREPLRGPGAAPSAPILGQDKALPLRLPWANRGVLRSDLTASPRPLEKTQFPASHKGPMCHCLVGHFKTEQGLGRAMSTRSSSAAFQSYQHSLYLRISLATGVAIEPYDWWSPPWHKASPNTSHIGLLYTDEREVPQAGTIGQVPICLKCW